MYKLLIVDDERIIREGISNMIDWEEMGISLPSTAQNGEEAYRRIVNANPDIVITDIKMPGMDGLELARKIKEHFPEIIVVVLSGYDEFELVRKAMEYGVKYYLLKPCGKEEIAKITGKILMELKQKCAREELAVKTKQDLEKVLPQVKEQFLRDFIMNKQYSKADFNFLKDMCNIEDDLFRLILFSMEGNSSFTEKYVLKNIAEDVLKGQTIHLSTVIEGNVLVLIGSMEFDKLSVLIKEIKKGLSRNYSMDITTAISDERNLEEIPLLYKEAQECLRYRFYLGDGSIITKKDTNHGSRAHVSSLTFDFEKITGLIKSGNIREVSVELDKFFRSIDNVKYEINITKTYCLELFLAIIRQSCRESMSNYMGKIAEFTGLNTLEQMHKFIKTAALNITEANYKDNISKYSAVVNTVIKYIESNLDNEELSLIWIANKILYMNEDYLGKLFKKETNEKFSQYVIRTRLEKAKELLKSDTGYKTFEVAEKTGFGKNSQYFSQVFKKHTGYTPSEYKQYN